MEGPVFGPVGELMTRVVFQDEDTALRVIADLDVTAYIESGVGPVKLGRPVQLADGSFVVSHPFEALDVQWIEAFAADPGLRVEEV